MRAELRETQYQFTRNDRLFDRVGRSGGVREKQVYSDSVVPSRGSILFSLCWSGMNWFSLSPLV